VPNQVRNILNDEQVRSEDGNIIRNCRQNAVVTISAVVIPISELAKTFARRPGSEQVDLA
jgi:hypothetical protein